MKPRCARGHQKQDATSGHTKIEGKSLLVRGLNALAAAICPALGTPLIAATRLRGGNANAARGTASLAAEAARGPAADAALVIVSADSAYYCGAVHRAG